MTAECSKFSGHGLEHKGRENCQSNQELKARAIVTTRSYLARPWHPAQSSMPHTNRKKREMQTEGRERGNDILFERKM